MLKCNLPPRRAQAFIGIRRFGGLRRPCGSEILNNLYFIAFQFIILLSIIEFNTSLAIAAPSVLPQLRPSVTTVIEKLIQLPAPLKIIDNKNTVFDKKNWTSIREDANTELLNAIKSDTRVAVIKTFDGKVDSFTIAMPADRKKKSKLENEVSITFKDGAVVAITNCQNDPMDTALGRICETATPVLCKKFVNQVSTSETGLKVEQKTTPISLSPEDIKEIDEREMRGLALILTLRGSDHQLSNLAHFGNRLGLKHALQTTKGQLILSSKIQVKNVTTLTDQQSVAVKDGLIRLRHVCKISPWLIAP
jgi:hypothetical protein